MPKLEFEWGLSDPDEKGLVMVRCHLVGTEVTSFFGPMPQPLALPFIRAKRDALDRSVRKELDAVKMLMPPVPLLGKPKP